MLHKYNLEVFIYFVFLETIYAALQQSGLQGLMGFSRETIWTRYLLTGRFLDHFLCPFHGNESLTASRQFC